MNKHLERWIGPSVFTINVTRFHRSWIEGIALPLLALAIFWFFWGSHRVVASAEFPPCQNERMCPRVDVLFRGPKIHFLNGMGCSYDAVLYAYGVRMSTNKFSFSSSDGGCPESVNIKWNSPEDCTINFDGKTASIKYSRNHTEWKLGTP